MNAAHIKLLVMLPHLLAKIFAQYSQFRPCISSFGCCFLIPIKKRLRAFTIDTSLVRVEE